MPTRDETTLKGQFEDESRRVYAILTGNKSGPLTTPTITELAIQCHRNSLAIAQLFEWLTDKKLMDEKSMDEILLRLATS
jgi:hypothetical protein